MGNIDISQVMQDANQSEFWALRAFAIQAYASLEQSLFSLFVSLTGMDHASASIVFFKIASQPTRNSILDKLFQRKHGTNFSLFRNSLITQLRPIDVSRNEIVHWNTLVNTDGVAFKEVVLMAPSYLHGNTEGTRNTQYLVDFMEKCNFYQRLIAMFNAIVMHTAPGIPEDAKQTWLDIFSQPIAYPPPKGHPLFPKGQVPGSQPQSSQP